MITEKSAILTSIISVRFDSVERMENLLATIKFIKNSIKTNILVFECAGYNNGLLEKLLEKNIQYVFQEDHDPILHRTRYLN